MPYSPSCLRGALALASVALTLTACGGSGASSGGGNPVKIMVVGQFEAPAVGFAYPEVRETVKAHAAALNDRGGLKGRPIQILDCNDQGDPNQAGKCARDAVRQRVVAVLAGYSIQTTTIMPILQQANIPFVGDVLFGGPEATSKISFPADGGTVVAGVDTTSALMSAGCKTIGYVGLDNAPSRLVGEWARRNVTAKGGRLVDTYVPPTGVPSYTAQVATLTGQGATCLSSGVNPAEFTKLLNAVEATGKKIPIATTAGAGASSATSPAAEGLILTAPYYMPADTTAAGIAELRKEMARYAPGVTLIPYGVSVMIGFRLLEQAAAAAPELTSTALLTALGSLQNADTKLTAPLTTTRELAVPNYNRMFNTSSVIYKVQGGKLVRDGEFIDHRAQLEKLASGA